MFKVRLISLINGQRKASPEIIYNDEAQMKRAIASSLIFGWKVIAVEVSACSA